MHSIFLPHLQCMDLMPVITQQRQEFPVFYPQNIQSINYFNTLTIYLHQAAWKAKELYTHQLNQVLQYQRLNYNKCELLSQFEQTKVDFVQMQTDALKLQESAEKIVKEMKKAKEKECTSHLKTRITEMVNFFIEEYGTAHDAIIDEQRSRYVSNEALAQLFDSLREKYSAARKCREDMIRLSLRKAITCLRDSLRDQLNISARAASIELCKRYFGVKEEDLVKMEDDGSDDETQGESTGFLLPYKKNSKYSTPSMCFIQEIFASKKFHEDYVKYLSQLDEILELDNKKKIPKFVSFLVECVKKNMICRVKNYKRLPWLKVWLKATKIVAVELLDISVWKDIPKERLKGSKKRKQKLVRVKSEKI